MELVRNEEKRAEYTKRAKELVSKMTLEEKVQQTLYQAPAIERLGIKAYNWWNEALHGVARAGVATVFPQAIGLAATFDEDLAEEVAEAVSTEGRAKFNMQQEYDDTDIYKGLTFWSPNVNIFRDPRWGRGHETFGEDPYLTSRMGVRYVEGLQGHDEKYLKAAACAKHFAVHSGPEDLRHHFNAVATKQDMYETYLPAFKTCVQEGKVEAVMGAYNRTNGEPCCGSKTLLQDILRKEWGFEGHVVSDCWAIKDFHEGHMVTDTPLESAALAMNNGCDLNCGTLFAYLKEAVEKGMVKEERLDEALVHLFTTRMMLGVFDQKGENPYDQIPYEVVDSKPMQELNLKASEKCITLLKNENHMLPLDKSKIKTIGVIGPNADSRAALIGNYHGTSSEYITVLEGIREEAGDDVRILYSQGCDLYKDKVENLAWDQDRISEAVITAENSDVVILCVGLNETLEGEEGDTGNSDASGDKVDLHLPKVQEELIEKVTAVGKPTIVVLMAGSAIDLNYAQDNCNGILLAWYPGARGGRAIADLLFGKESPSGKLPITFYKDLEGMPEFTDYSMKNRTYRYMEKEALYPFGYGLTYSDTCVTEAEVVGEVSAESDIVLKATVKNNGTVDTDEVVQVYIKDLDSPLAVRNYSLCGFKRVSLKAGEEKSVEFTISNKAMNIVDEDGNRYIAGKHFRLFAGVSQPDTRSAELTGHKPAEVEIAL